MRMQHSPTPSDRVATGDDARLLIGLDAGKVTTSLAWGRRGPDGALVVEGSRAVRHVGEPLAAFFELYREVGAEHVAGVVAAGAFGDRLTTPALAGVPEEIVQEWAARALHGGEPLAVVRIGGSGYSVLTRDAAGRVAYERNERCSAGTGETVEGLCARLGCDLDEAVALAVAADRGITVTSRCAVFAKSELTHYANQGEDHGRLFRGLFEGVARNVHALYDRNKVDGPVVLIGHGATIAPLVDAFREPDRRARRGLPAGRRLRGARRPAARRRPGLGRPAVARPTPRSSWSSAAAGCAPWCRRPPAPARSCSSPRRTARRPQRGRDRGARPRPGLHGLQGRAHRAPHRRSAGQRVPAHRRQPGRSGQASRGRSARRAARRSGGGDRPDRLGPRRSRHRGARRLPELERRLTVLNEIVAHAAAAVRFDADGGRSLSIVEIGGQDAKFINVRDGRVLESDMNRVCSAGTGSFLEEQALAHGLDDIAGFGALAARSVRPPDLGQTCTVFVADVADEALADGFDRDDIFAGLQYSVIKNYIGRVMGDRRLLDRVFFQGKPASNPSLARTLAAVTGREVVVPPDPGAMGALGIALLAGAALTAAAADAAIDLEVFASARVVERKSGRCGDRDCANLCRLETAIVEVAGQRRRVVSGGNCPKYDARSEVGAKLPKDAPNPYRERAELRAACCGSSIGTGPDGAGRRPRGDRPAGRPPHRPAAGALPDRHAALLRRLPCRPRRRRSRCCARRSPRWPSATGAARRPAPALRSRSLTASRRRRRRSTRSSRRPSSTCRRTARPAPTRARSPRARRRCWPMRSPPSRRRRPCAAGVLRRPGRRPRRPRRAAPARRAAALLGVRDPAAVLAAQAVAAPSGGATSAACTRSARAPWPSRATPASRSCCSSASCTSSTTR